jgi:hypothetical protein
MVRATKIGSVVVSLAASGLAWGQTALTPPAPVAEPAGKVITVNEPGKPAQKCRLIKMWSQPGGGKACQVQTIDTGHIMTIVQSGPTAPGADGKTMAMMIYHWSGSMPHPDAPMPPITKEVTPIVRTRATTVIQQGEPMPTGAPVVSTPTNVTSAFMNQPMQPDHAPRPMTPGGVVLTPVPTMHDGSSSTTCGDCGPCNACTTCKPSMLDRIKACFHRDCSTGCCSDSCTTCTTATPIPTKTAAGETIVPVPTAPAAPAPTPTPAKTTKTTSSLFHRQRLAGDDLKEETPRADAKKPDPLKDPAAYTPSKTTAELAISPTPRVDVAKSEVVIKTPRGAGSVMQASDTPLGAGSVIQAGDPQFVPVPMVTIPDVAHRPAPPTQIPQAPQPNQRLMANAFNSGMMPVAPPMATGAMAGNAFGPNQYAAAMADGAFHQGMPNARGYIAPGFAPPGYGGMAYSPMLPPAPMGAAVQPGYSVPPGGQMVAPAGYQMVAPVGYPMQGYASSIQPLMQPVAPGIDLQSLINQLRDSMLPSQREWAAIKLSELDWRHQSIIVDSLVQSAKDDPAASVRAGCVHGLAKMNVGTQPVIALLNSLCSDPDSRVQHEASEALAKLAPKKAPSLMADPAIQPAGATLQPPPRSN